MNENVLEVVKTAMRHNKVPVTYDTIIERLKSHPQYPSLKSVCDAFKEWKVEHYPMRLDLEELKEADTSFIAHLNGDGEKLAFVPALNGASMVEYFDGYKKPTKTGEKDFLKNYSGIAVLIDADNRSGEERYTEKRQTEILHKGLPFLIVLGVIILIANSKISQATPDLSISFVLMLLTKLVGLCLSVMLVLKDLNIKNSFADTLCGIGRKTNCNSILNTDAARLFAWVHWSDIGVIYFLSGSIMISYADINDFTLMAYLSIGGLGYAVYSIYYQAVVAKTWCPLCLGIQAIFIAEVALSYTYISPIQISWMSIFKFGSITMITILMMVLFKAYYISRQTAKNERLMYLRFKRNPNVFINQLKQNDHKQFNISEEIFTVSKGEPGVEVTAFLSLNCNPCRKAFHQLKELFEREEVTIQMILSFHEKNKGLVNNLARLFREKNQNEAMALLESWYNNKDSKLPEAGRDKIEEEGYERMSKIHQQFFKESEVSATPTIFVNGYKLPIEYEVKDLAYFIDVLRQKNLVL
ncbi:MAG TPA: hypothetical protein DDX98_03800 [Bacteroidales bacterium]|jgi:uncharacterized membrane protein|nr:hypothetical protein [Bacteroidales bacterium]